MAKTKNEKIALRYLNKYFKYAWITEHDEEYRALVRVLNRKDKTPNK